MDVQLDTLIEGPHHPSAPLRAAATTAFAIGGLLLVWSSYIHFHLWDSIGYRHIPTIGPLFLLQSITGAAIGVVVIAVRRVWIALIGVGFAVSTVIGFLLSVEHGLFGFKDGWSAPFAAEAFAVEVAAIVALILAALLCLVGPSGRALDSVDGADQRS